MRVTGRRATVQIGVDVGGTKIEPAALDVQGEFLARIRRATPSNYDAAIQLACELYQRLPPTVRAHVFAQTWSARIVAARWGDSSGVRGAARLGSSA